MKMKLKIIPQEIIDQYQLQDLEEDGWVYMKIVKGVPGLKQSARLPNERLVHHLAPYGYAPIQHTPSLWKHESNGILFALVVDDFGIKSTCLSSYSKTSPNCVVSTKDEKFTTAEIKDFFYASFLPDSEYMKMKLKIIPQ